MLDGGDEEGFLGNGTWVHARDPRYAAQDVIAVGCAAVTRDDYADPTRLEGNYVIAQATQGSGWYWNSATSKPRPVTSISTESSSRPVPPRTNRYTPRSCQPSVGWSTAVPTPTANGPKSPNGTVLF